MILTSCSPCPCPTLVKATSRKGESAVKLYTRVEPVTVSTYSTYEEPWAAS